MPAVLYIAYATDYDFPEDVRSMFDFGFLVLGIYAVVVAVIVVALCLKQRRLHRLTNPRMDYYRKK